MSSFDPIRALLSEMSPIEGAAALLVLINVWLDRAAQHLELCVRDRRRRDLRLGIFPREALQRRAAAGLLLVVQLYGLQQWRRSQADSGEVVVERLGVGTRFAWAGGMRSRSPHGAG